MNADELREIARRSTEASATVKGMRQKSFRRSRRLGIKDFLFYAFIGLFGISVWGSLSQILEDPQSRQQRLAEQVQQSQTSAIERERAAADRARTAKEEAKMMRLDACTEQESMAFVYSQMAVRAYLKAPSTASFPWTPVLSRHVGNCDFKVVSYVDAQNGFGAMIRSNFVAVLSYNPETKKWRAKSVNINNR